MGWKKGMSGSAPKKPESIDKKDPALVRGALKFISQFGELLEGMKRDSVMYDDTKKLPVPKIVVKAALKIAWTVAPNDHVRDTAEALFLCLCNFQDGIGNTPVRNLTPADAKAFQTLDQEARAVELRRQMQELERFSCWTERANAEMAVLEREFDEFKMHPSGD